MTVVIDGTTGIDAVQNGTVAQADLAANVAGTGPAFRAYASSATNIANSTSTKLVYATEVFDTNSNYDTTTSRFTPSVAGIYLISANHYVIDANLGGYMQLSIHKNGAAVAYSTVSTAVGVYINEVQTIIDANGTTDYFEVYVNQSSGATRNSGTGLPYSFSAAMVRAA